MSDKDWGIAQAPAATPATTTTIPTVPVAVGVGVGALGGALLGGLMKHPLVGAAVGGVAGGAAGYYVGKSSAAAAPAGVSSPTTLPSGPYATPPKVVQGGSSVTLLQPQETYLLSVPAGSSPTTTLQSTLAEVQTLGLTLDGAWSGAPPAGWPATDPNFASGVFVAVFVPGSMAAAVAISGATTVWATNGMAG